MKLKYFKLTVVAILALFIVLFLVHRETSNYGDVEIILQVPDTTRVSTNIDGSSQTVKSLDETYKLKAGPSSLYVTKPGYKSFSANFTTSRGKTLIISVNMQPVIKLDQASANSSLSSSLANILPAGNSIQLANFFYNNTWAVVKVSDSNDVSILVARFNIAQNTWSVIIGPGTLFDTQGMKSLPGDVKTYMYAQHYAINGNFQNE